jgi:hypothetical protein
MKNIIQLIKEHKFTEAEDQIDSLIPLIMEKKIFEMKKAVAAKMSEQMGVKSASDKVRAGIMEDEIEESINPTEIHNGPAPKGQRVNSADKGDKQPPNTTVVPKNNLKEEEELDEARISIVRARVRGGKIQRRKKVSNVPGMTLRGGTLKRMSAAERRRRKMGARKGKMKRKAKLSRSLMKRKRSLQKRKSLGL